ncbi:predicted protein [Coccidioides posadasii str. Silveira]|uniref:Predicted protein n=1 Tax=Coccidioides posadasii (strain RMSCC 757 / Silveira) TaxID=443226 RepID=E9D3C9_COCPS|nr:predicted protein [Coccidioides posadasii str. Silveira]
MAKRVHGRELRAAADGTNFPTPLDTALPGPSLEGMPCGPGGAKGCGRKNSQVLQSRLRETDSSGWEELMRSSPCSPKRRITTTAHRCL